VLPFFDTLSITIGSSMSGIAARSS